MDSSPLDPRAVALAVSIVRRCGPSHPADAVLRETLRGERGLGADTAAGVARGVFATFRWRGWLENPADVAGAVALEEQFEREPARFAEADLLARAVPAWAREELDVTPAWVRQLQTRPALWLRARPGQAESLAARLGECRLSGALPDAVEFLGQRDLFRTPELHAGEFEIQDIASQAVGRVCGAQPGETWWDACAGEGGKTLHLSDLMGNKGLIWASDRADWRLRRLKLRAARAKTFNYRAVAWDGGAKLPTRTRFDGVLVDAPCSGLGTWQRNPHARWTTTPEDVRELAAVQARLLDHVAPSVKPGARLIYAVCTVTRAETDGVTAAFEAAHPEFEPLALANPFPAGTTSRANALLWWPQDTRGNGMYVVAWRRKPA